MQTAHSTLLFSRQRFEPAAQQSTDLGKLFRGVLILAAVQQRTRVAHSHIKAQAIQFQVCIQQQTTGGARARCLQQRIVEQKDALFQAARQAEALALGKFFCMIEQPQQKVIAFAENW